MKEYYFYFHAGSANHGCEAIVRSTQKLLGVTPNLVSSAVQEDYKYKLNEIANLQNKLDGESNLCEKIRYILEKKIFNSEKYGYEVRAKHECKEYRSGTIALSIGGDNYCYGEAYNLYLAAMNKQLHKKNIKTVLWGCSIEPSQVTREMQKDFSRYDLIVARESISYNELKKYNFNTVMTCDPAFTLNKEELPLPSNFVEKKTIGINVSPLIQKRETKSGITIDNYRKMLDYIIKETEYSIALIPHVVCDGNDDREPLKKLYNEFKNSGRVCMIEDCNCEQLKGYISRCCMFIGARTHATIAAYSTGVPTLVIGYSTKAKGIAKDLFGEIDNYVLPVQQLKNKDDMLNNFKWLEKNQKEIKEHLKKIMPEYVKSMQKVLEKLEAL